MTTQAELFDPAPSARSHRARRSGRKAPVAVVGGGLAGLTALAFLARSGVPAVLFERSTSAGGRARTTLRDGFAYNLGPHALYRGPGRAILGELDVEPRGRRAGIDGALAIRDGRAHTLPVGFASLAATDLFSVGDKLALARVLAGLRGLAASAPATISFAAWLELHVRAPAVREYLAALARLSCYAASADHLSARGVLEQLVLANDGGVDYLDGGWQQLADELAARAHAWGAEVRTGAPVIGVDHEHGLAVRFADGERFEASGVVLAVGPDAAHAVLDGAPRAYLESVPAIEALLARDVRLVSDGGGEVHAALRPIVGVERVVRFYRKLFEKRGLPMSFALRTFNGAPAALVEHAERRAGEPTRFVIVFDVGRSGRIRALHGLFAPSKLQRLA